MISLLRNNNNTNTRATPPTSTNTTQPQKLSPKIHLWRKKWQISGLNYTNTRATHPTSTVWSSTRVETRSPQAAMTPPAGFPSLLLFIKMILSCHNYSLQKKLLFVTYVQTLWLAGGWGGCLLRKGGDNFRHQRRRLQRLREAHFCRYHQCDDVSTAHDIVQHF